MTKLSPNFSLEEFIPKGMKAPDVPHPVLGNITALVTLLLQPCRDALGVKLIPTNCWRLPDHNAAVGGVPASDHLNAAAVDFQATSNGTDSWQDVTFAAFRWLLLNKIGEFGQLILEDHRAHYGNPNKLWIHVSLKTSRHGGAVTDTNRLLVSSAPKEYEPWTDGRFA